jgi:ubiE/COQ5 methyltransferase family
MTAGLLRPLAEQLLHALDISEGATVCELLCDSGALTRSLAAAAGAAGTLILTETDPVLLERCASDVRALCTVRTDVTDGRSVRVDNGACDRVASLLTLNTAVAEPLLHEARRIVSPTGLVACVVWDQATPPPYETALAVALRDELALGSSSLRLMTEPAAVPDGYAITALRDVARFDGFDSLWAAMLEGRSHDELAALSESQRGAVRRRWEVALAPCAAADGTLRIPVTVRLVRLSVSR